MPEPFEDGYGHWLIAANLASTGSLHDPLFGMEDTWLPGYHVLAAAVLHVFGLWQLGALKALGAVLGMATLACVYCIAPNARQGRLAVILLALNPVFLFTSGSAVVEPLLTTLLAGAALAGVRGRMRLAALLAAAAARPATKGWHLVGLVSAVRRREPAGGRAALRFLHVPALVYLSAVFGLVAVGVYSGSHRYLYPALPSLALLAAAALDRHPAFARIGAAAAGALLAVAFLPVFAGFASGNDGLVAAGKVASNSRGMLVTDSPAVAFYSHRNPTDISGSQILPAGREQAIAWMKRHGVTTIVLEGISYYRATSLFPDLASGRAAPPFVLLGEQAQYQVPGGKPVFAYRFGDELLTQPIFEDVAACIEGTPGPGKTAPLAKGVVLEISGRDISGEGMGLGVPIVHYPDGWVYSRTATTADLSTPTATTWRRTFYLDEIGGDAAHSYAFVPIESRGAIDVTYSVDATGISVAVRILKLAPGYTEVGILNEQSAAFNDFAAQTSPTLVDGKFGTWVPVDGTWARLQSKSLGVQWSVPSLAGAQFSGGRELIPPDFDWAGLDYIFGPSFAGATYVFNVQKAR